MNLVETYDRKHGFNSHAKRTYRLKRLLQEEKKIYMAVRETRNAQSRVAPSAGMAAAARGRGRPRLNATPQLYHEQQQQRGRGRPRLNAASQQQQRGRGRPRLNAASQQQRGRGRPRLNVGSQQQVERMQMPKSILKLRSLRNIDRDWIRKELLISNESGVKTRFGTYSPQVGDRVVYSSEGHEEYLKRMENKLHLKSLHPFECNPIHRDTKLRPITKLGRDFVCDVLAVDYDFPCIENLRLRNKDSKCPLECIVTLKLHGCAPSPKFQPIEPRTTENFPFTLTLRYRPLVVLNQAWFLIPISLYISRVRMPFLITFNFSSVPPIICYCRLE